MRISAISRFLVTTALAVLWLPAPAQTGPEVPCEGCPLLQQPPYPETGIWRNPHQSGTGFMLEIQNGHLGGFYYLYDPDGAPTWYLLAGELELVAIPGIMGAGTRRWEAEAELERLEGGACLGCPFQPPVVAEPAGTVRFEFLQRNFARFRIDDGEPQNMLTLTYGVAGHAEFAPVTEYKIPNLDGFWSLTVESGALYTSRAVRLENLSPDGTGALEALISSAVKDGVPSPVPAVLGDLRCGSLGDIPGPLCEIRLNDLPSQIFRMPLGNLGNGSFRAESEDGRFLEARRLDYD